MKLPVAASVESLAVYQPGKPIEETKRELGLSDVIKLASNENPLGPSPKAVAAIAQTLSDLHLYPDGSGFHVKQALGAQLGVKTDEIILGNGSNEILEFVTRVLCKPNNNVVIGWPSFVIYALTAQAAGHEVRRVPMPNYHYDADKLLAAIDEQTTVVMVGNPSNPTGTYLPKNQLTRIVEAVPPTTLLLIDEAYFEYVDAADYVSGLTLRRPNVLVLRTFSKAYGLAGMRLGYGVGDPELLGYLNRVREPFNVNAMAQAGGIAALTDFDHVQRCVGENRRERERVALAFSRLGLKVIPSQANFILVDFARPADDIYLTLLKQGIITRPMKPYDLPNALRLSFGTRDENDRLIAAVEALV